MATRIILANACCGKRGEQCLSTMVPSVSFDSMASAEHRTARQSSAQRAANAAVPGARDYGHASGRAAQFCQELPVDARLMFKTSKKGENEICLVRVN